MFGHENIEGKNVLFAILLRTNALGGRGLMKKKATFRPVTIIKLSSRGGWKFYFLLGGEKRLSRVATRERCNKEVVKTTFMPVSIALLNIH